MPEQETAKLLARIIELERQVEEYREKYVHQDLLFTAQDDRDAWKGQYEACHKLHLEALEETEKANTFVYQFQIASLKGERDKWKRTAGEMARLLQDAIELNVITLGGSLEKAQQEYNWKAAQRVIEEVGK